MGIPLKSLTHQYPQTREARLSKDACCTLFQFSAVISDPMQPHGLQTPGLPVHHQLLELAQTYVHRDDDAIQSSHHLSSPSLPAFNLSQHQDLFQ